MARGHSCKICNYQGRKDLETIEISAINDKDWKAICKAAKEKDMTVERFFRHAIHDMVSRESGANLDDVGSTGPGAEPAVRENGTSLSRTSNVDPSVLGDM